LITYFIFDLFLYWKLNANSVSPPIFSISSGYGKLELKKIEVKFRKIITLKEIKE